MRNSTEKPSQEKRQVETVVGKVPRNEKMRRTKFHTNENGRNARTESLCASVYICERENEIVKAVTLKKRATEQVQLIE